jgi:GMP synthase (glutamine-hydrolysing)
MPRRDGDAEASGEGTSWIVLRHTPVEGLGLLGNALREVGVHHRYLDLAKGEPLPRDLRGMGGLIILGGPMAAYETDRHPFLAAELDLMERTMTAGRPMLGICLGAQMIAQVLGARVYRGEKPEVGWGPVELTADGRDDPLLVDVDSPLTVFHLHADTYELPADARNLARTKTYEQQAFSWGDLVYGFQFHLEFNDTIIARLAAEPDSRKFIETAGVDPQALVRDAPAHLRELSGVAQRVFSRFFSQCGL